MNLNLNHHPIWDELDEILNQIDVKTLVMGHLASCHYTVHGYWDGDEFYDEIIFVSPLHLELVNGSIGQTQIDYRCYRWVRLQFILTSDTTASETEHESDDEDICELTLVLDSDWKIVDENWLIDVESPFVIAKKSLD